MRTMRRRGRAPSRTLPAPGCARASETLSHVDSPLHELVDYSTRVLVSTHRLPGERAACPMVIKFPVPVATTATDTTDADAATEREPESALFSPTHTFSYSEDNSALDTVPWEMVVMARGVMHELAHWTPDDWRWCMEQAIAGDMSMRRCQWMFAVLAWHVGHEGMARWMAHDRRGMARVLCHQQPRPHLVRSNAGTSIGPVSVAPPCLNDPTAGGLTPSSH